MASVDQLKTLVNSKLGYASANQFMVTLPTDFQSRSILGTITSLITTPVGALFGGCGGNDGDAQGDDHDVRTGMRRGRPKEHVCMRRWCPREHASATFTAHVWADHV